MQITLEQREEASLARRIVRATEGSATRKRLIKQANRNVLKMVEVMPQLLESNCIAAAYDKAIAHAYNSNC